jgi:hypothetical protein
LFVITVAQSAFRPLARRVRRSRLVPACLAAWAQVRRLFPAAGTKAPRSPRHPRPVTVPDSLADLKGPKSGVVELPVTLFGSRPDRTFDLSDRYRAIDMYLAILDAARGPDDLVAYLNGDLLIELWPDLHLTRAKRRPWEDRFAALRPASAAA